jgi:hypothetical protein
MVPHTCHPSFGRNHKTELWSSPTWQKPRHYLQNNQSKKDWRNGSSASTMLQLKKKNWRGERKLFVFEIISQKF